MGRQIDKLKEKVEKKSSRTNRVRTGIFGEGDLEDNYMDLQREWTRNNARPSKESRDRNRQVRRIKSDTSSPPTRRAPGVRPQESFGWEGHNNISSIRKIRQVKEAVGSKRSKIDLSDTDEEGDYVDLSDTDEEGDYVPGLHPKMVGYGDFRGYHLNNPDSRYTAMIKRIKEGKVSDPTLKENSSTKLEESGSTFAVTLGQVVTSCQSRWQP